MSASNDAYPSSMVGGSLDRFGDFDVIAIFPSW
jgi:hypothetical protein